MTVDSADTAVLVQHLGPDVQEASVSTECLSIMKIFALSAEELSYKWESYVMKMGDTDMKLNVDNLRQFQAQLQNELETRSKQPVSATPAASRPTPLRLNGTPASAGSNGSPSDFLDSMLTPGGPGSRKRRALGTTQTPSRVRTKTEASSPSQAGISRPPLSSPAATPAGGNGTPYRHRTDAGTVVETLNPTIERAGPQASSDKSRVKIMANVNVKKFNHRILYRKISEADEVLDLQIEEFMDVVCEAQKLDVSDLGNPALASREEIVAVGRVVSDSLGDERPNSKSLMLEACRRLSGGARVRLDVSQLSQFSLFPGQIIAVRGTNANGDYFAVRELLELPLLPGSATLRSELEESLELQSHEPISIFVAAGPYTTSDNLDFEPLQDFVDYINRSKPDVVILNGPFVDRTHPLIESGDFELPDSNTGTLDDIFRTLVRPKLLAIDANVQVVMVPNLRDVTQSHVTFPQKQFDRKSLDLPRHFKTLPNPCTLSLNEVVVTTASVDSVQDILRSSVRSPGPPPLLPSAQAFDHILRQRRVYPVFPGTTGSDNGITRSRGVNLDVPYLGLTQISNALPDILIVPSGTRHVAQVVNNVVTINPGQLTRQTGGGAFAAITVQPLTIEGDADTVDNQVWERARVDIIKI